MNSDLTQKINAKRKVVGIKKYLNKNLNFAVNSDVIMLSPRIISREMAGSTFF